MERSVLIGRAIIHMSVRMLKLEVAGRTLALVLSVSVGHTVEQSRCVDAFPFDQAREVPHLVERDALRHATDFTDDTEHC